MHFTLHLWFGEIDTIFFILKRTPVYRLSLKGLYKERLLRVNYEDLDQSIIVQMLIVSKIEGVNVMSLLKSFIKKMKNQDLIILLM